MPIFGFLYETDRGDDNGYREIEAATYEEGRLKWLRQVKAEGQTVRLSAAQCVSDLSQIPHRAPSTS
jgi:hypothetical protein